MNSNNLIIKQKQKQTNKQKLYMKIEFQLNCKIKFFVPYNKHHNCLDKSLARILAL